MKYFDSAWQEREGLPDNAKMLVRSVGTYHVNLIMNGLREFSFPFFLAAERKDDVSFYVPEDQYETIRDKIRTYSLGKQHKDAADGNHPDDHIS